MNMIQKSATSQMIFPNNSQDWLCRLIGFNTVSKESNLALIDDVANFCQSLGLSVRLTFNQPKIKANLFVTVPAYQDNQLVLSGGFVLSGHTDVVPVDGQNWQSNPFVAQIRDGKLYGRGACDMKGFIACGLAILPKIVALSQAKQLKKPIHLALSFDEEIGCLGVPLLLQDLANQKIMPEYCIVGEPTMMKMVVAHKGIQVYRCRVHGKSTHSSLTPQGVNAISYASKVIDFIDNLAIDFSQRRDLDDYFDVPFATLSVGTIQGGTATNIVPNFCEFTFDYRNLPHMTSNDVVKPIQQFIDKTLLPKMQAIDPNSHIELLQEENVPAMTDQDNQALQRLIATLVDDSQRHKVAYATEGGQFSQAGIATIICGPGNIAQAHRADEFVSLAQLAKCDDFLQKIINLCC